ncbi:GATA transcription factor 21-like [Olea europaea var. sylvestris]|uniref:GATA transcription factor 21-like n=1 Tax=Olea europaea var. sylvestris TaxID=158386 RepID=UPI000C1D7BC2|nr:GATA transcription factor 21-like [Olea europaea var. sylvestris]
MNPINLNSSPFVLEPNEELDDQNPPQFGVNHHIASSSSHSCHYFFNSTQDYAKYYRHELYQPQQHQEDFSYAYGGGSYDVENKVDSGLKLTLWKKLDPSESVLENNNNPVKWMSSKMRLMHKMKNSDHAGLKITSGGTEKYENHQKQPSSSLETDLSSNSISNNNSPIRVCTDCNTTKTPLWRSGPKGPKSLCNACGIRQRKARQAMAAAAAADANGTAITTKLSPMKIKVHHKDKTSKSGHATQLKKRCKITSGPSNDTKKLGLEDFLINLSKNLALNRVFPQDEKDAAILLMALSSGLVHG